MTDIMWLILGMMAVTYLPRFLPFLIKGERSLPKKLTQFLDYIPYVVLGALIFPGALTAVQGQPLASLSGLAFAAGYRYFKEGLIGAVIGGIGVTYLFLLF